MPSKKDIHIALKNHLVTYSPTSHQILVRYGQLDDFIQEFLIEAHRHWTKPENCHMAFIDYAWKYARIRVTLPSRKVYSLIVLRAIRYSSKTKTHLEKYVTKEYSEIIDFVDFVDSRRYSNNSYLSIDVFLEINKLRRYLVENCRQDVIDYFDLLRHDLEKSEISSILKLSKRETGLLQERFRYFVNRYQGISPYELKRKSLVNHRT